MGLTALTEGNTVTVSWSAPSSGDSVTGFTVYYHHPNHDTTVRNVSSSDYSHTFTEENDRLRVYSVSVQTLSEHYASDTVGPVTVRGQR